MDAKPQRTEVETAIRTKMGAAGIADPTIRSFVRAALQVMDGATGLLPEARLEPINYLPSWETEIAKFTRPSAELVDQLAVIKLNGGLGTSMGLDRAKSLLPVKDGDCFLDFIAHQILYLRSKHGTQGPLFFLMNSHATREDSLRHLEKYPALAADGPLDFLQNRVPKLLVDSLAPVAWPEAPSLEWCPPGHGDIYPSLASSGMLETLRQSGIRYLFVSNADNLGATVDLPLLAYFAQSGLSFLMEVAQRTSADRKGGHLARRSQDGRLLLRESAQTPEEDREAFQNIVRHRFFNTNNLWIRVEDLEQVLKGNQGTLPLPLIRNRKPVDPQQPDSPAILQLESAMGAAIECFSRAGALVVPRSRFAPVKTTGDLLNVRSDAYQTTVDHRLALCPQRQGQPPLVQLDPQHYTLLEDFEKRFPHSPPSLLKCRSLTVKGGITFGPGVRCEGDVEFVNRTDQVREVSPGEYRDTKTEV